MDQIVRQRLSEYTSPEEAIASGEFLFHGTCVPFDDRPRGGGYDQVFWTASDSCIAQSYIPASGLEAYLSYDEWRANDKVRPHPDSHWWSVVARHMGIDLNACDPEFDQYGQLVSFRHAPGHPTYRDAYEHLQELGYSADRNGTIRIKVTSDNHLFPADYRMPGRLFIIYKDPSLKLANLSQGEGDLMTPDYHRLDDFRAAEDAGYDGIIIDDFAQSQNLGNVGHRSWGFFDKAIEKLSIIEMPACAYDWRELACEDHGVTPEFREAFEELRSQLAPAPSL